MKYLKLYEDNNWTDQRIRNSIDDSGYLLYAFKEYLDQFYTDVEDVYDYFFDNQGDFHIAYFDNNGQYHHHVKDYDELIFFLNNLDTYKKSKKYNL